MRRRAMRFNANCNRTEDHNVHDIRYSRFWKVICFFTRTDLDVLAECYRFDRITVIWTAIALVLAFILHTVLWSNVALILVTVPILAVLTGILIATLICTLEAAMAASDWSLAGVLRQPGFDWHRARLIGGRLLVACILSYATAFAFELYLHGPELLHHQEAERRAANAPLIEEAKREKARLHGELVQPVERALAQAEADRTALRVFAEQAARDEQTASARANVTAIEAQAEYNGLDRLKGPGPRYKDALLREQQARAEADGSRQRAVEARQTFSKLDRQVETLRADLTRASDELAAKSLEIDARTARDDRYELRRDSLLSRKIALNKIYRDPEEGDAAREIHLITQGTLICLELILLMVKILFQPASCYTVRLIARTRLEAARIDEELARELAALRTWRGGLHVTANEDAEANAAYRGNGQGVPVANAPEHRRQP
ncbi:MAG: DUF4407 domain-containing protein [Gammaproteobacteria bacterium]